MNPTASKLELLERCPAAGALSSVWTMSTDDQIAGTARHRFIQRAREIGRDEALAEVPDDAPWRSQCEALVLDGVPVGDHEIAYAYDVAADTARCLGSWIDRAYEVSATEVSGTADLICPPTEERPRWLVIDFKGDEEVTGAASNIQLGFYALCVAREHHVDDVDVAIVYLGHGGGLRWDRASLGPFDLEGMAARVRATHAAVVTARARAAERAPLDYSMGLHCRRCAALTFCPAQTTLLRAFLDDPPTPESLAPLSDEDAGRAWVRFKVFEERIERARAALSARAERSGLPLPDGERLMPVEVPQRTVVLQKAEPLLRARFGDDQFTGALKRSLSIENLRALARQLSPGKGQKKAFDELLEHLRAAGALRESSFTQLRVKKAKGAKGSDAEEGGEP